MVKMIGKWIVSKLHKAVDKIKDDPVALRRVAQIIAGAIPISVITKYFPWLSQDVEYSLIAEGLHGALDLISQLLDNVKI